MSIAHHCPSDLNSLDEAYIRFESVNIVQESFVDNSEARLWSNAVCWLCFCVLRYLIDHGANVGAVNSEAELPLDVATEDAMERLLKAEIKKQGKESLHNHMNTFART